MIKGEKSLRLDMGSRGVKEKMWIYDYNSPQDNPYKEPPFLQITHMSHVDNLPHWTYPWHDHDGEYEVAFMLDGSGHLVINEQSLPVKAGAVTIVPYPPMYPTTL